MHEISSEFPDRSVKPFRLNRIPQFPLTGQQLADASPERAAQDHADVLGCALFQQHDDILSTFAALAEDACYRAKLGTLRAPPFEALAAMSPTDRAAAMDIASLAMVRLIEAFAHILGAGDRTIPGGYCIDYRLESRLTRIAEATSDGARLEASSASVIADDDQDVLLHSFNRWQKCFGANTAPR